MILLLYQFKKNSVRGIEKSSLMMFLFLVDRAEFMIDLKNTLTSLINSQLIISELKEQQESLISSARTRLKWAAGSNPVINEVSFIFFLVLVIHFVYGVCK